MSLCVWGQKPYLLESNLQGKAVNCKANFKIINPAQCLNDNYFEFINNSFSDSNLSFEWDFGDKTTSTSINPIHVYSKIGIYDVRLIAKNLYCSDTIVLQDTVNSHPRVAFSLDPARKNNDSIQCLYGNLFTFRNYTTISGGVWINVYFKWFVDTMLAETAYKASLHFSSPGFKKVKLIAISEKGWCTDTVSHAYIVLGNMDYSKISVSPKKMNLAINKFRFVNSNSTFNPPVWYVLGKYNQSFKDSLTGNSVEYSFKDSGTYYIIIKSHDTIQKCPITFKDSVKVFAGIDNIPNMISNITVYPNPSQNGIFTLLGVSQSSSICVYDLLGKPILSLSSTQEKFELDLRSFSKGQYIVVVNSSNRIYRLKLTY